MITPRIPENEVERIKALNETNLLDTPIEQNFERLTNLTKKIFDVPVVAISLIDKDRQWFKSISGTNLTETPREISFCGHTILHDEIMVVNDAQTDPRFSDNPLVTGKNGIRFYAGVPIHARDELPIGALCIVDSKPRQITAREKILLKDLANLVDSEIKNYRVLQEYLKKNMELESHERQILIDNITRLWNAAGFEQLLEQQMSLSLDKNECFGLLNVSIDSFNSFIEEYGEESGNDLLRDIANYLLENCTEDDAISYWGGKEYMIIVPDNNKSKIIKLANQLINNLENHPMPTHAGIVNFTLTVGLVFYDANIHHNNAEIIEEAHKALEEGRHNGGNQVVIR